MVETMALSKRKRRGLALAAAVYREPYRKRTQAAWSRLFGELRREVVAAMEEQRAPRIVRLKAVDVEDIIGEVLEPDNLATRMAEAMRTLNRSGLVLGGKLQRELLGDEGVDMPWSASNKAIDRYLVDYGKGHYMEIADETHRRMTETVANAVRDGEDWSGIRRAVEGEFGDMADYRSANIATTETTRLCGAGGDAFRSEYGIAQKGWLCSFVNSRPTHIAADGQVVGNDEDFAVGADHMPWPGEGHIAAEVCNCNCNALPVV